MVARLLLLVGLLLHVQAAPRGSPSARRLGHKKDMPTPSPTPKKHLYPSVNNEDNRVDNVNEGEVDWSASAAPSTPTFQASWEHRPVLLPVGNPPFEVPVGNPPFDVPVGTPPFEVPVSNPPFAAPVGEPVPAEKTRRPKPAPTFAPFVAMSASPTQVRSASPTLIRVVATDTPSTVPSVTPLIQTSSLPSMMPSSGPVMATYTPVGLTPVNYEFLGRLPTLQFVSGPTVAPSSAPSNAPIPGVVFPGTPEGAGPDVVVPGEEYLWTPLKTFDIQLSRDTRWNTQFAPDELQRGLEAYLVGSMMILSANVKNVTLTLFTSAYNEDQSEAWYRFQGKLFYKQKVEGRDISPDEAWSEQVRVLNPENTGTVKWILQNEPTMAVGFDVKKYSLLDGSASQTFEGYSGASSSNLDQMTKIIIAVAAILLILACSVGVYIFMFLEGESDEEPLPVIQTKLTPHTDSDLSVGKALYFDHQVPEVTFEQQDSPSEVSSITELRADEVVKLVPPQPSSVDALASDDSRLLSQPSSSNNNSQCRTPDMESLQPSTNPDWSMTAGTLADPPTVDVLGVRSEDNSADDGSVGTFT